ncbi:hypothetical protein [Natrialba sp. PRR66]|uniref:hypothetical protein n=1 Tax=Natrialba sp. PRR66 TaxID=3098146 RepID=UPI002B1D776E|nr:hypothetical protein [Natrialba sp. PRR66]
MTASAEATIRDYYDALRDGDPLVPYFRRSDSTVKFAISEALFGHDDIGAALREQTETTAEWTIESSHLVVTERGSCATFADEVTMAWTDTETGKRRQFETRWSGTLIVNSATDDTETDGAPTGTEREAASERETDAETETETKTTDRGWEFVSMHVSTADEV